MKDINSTLLTGANGFLGKYIYLELSKFGSVDTLGRSGATWNIDLSTSEPPLDKEYQLVVHSAGKAHSVPKTEAEKQVFYDVNLKGTENLLKALDLASRKPHSFVFISTVAVYGLESGLNIREDQPLNASDPYGKSKILAEELVAAWCNENNVICSILRLPLIAGENAPGNLKAMIKSIASGYYFNIAGGHARKSIVLAQDVAEIIMHVAEVGGLYNLTDGYHPSFAELSAAIAAQLNKKAPSLNMPIFVAKLLGKLGDILGERAPVNSAKIQKITSDLTFNDDKARRLLNWKPQAVTDGILL
jgi:nucleoside-diphosphate-sugar epimerase